MDRFQGVAEGTKSAVATPLTDAARFTITKLDVGSEAVRPGLAAELEQERRMLLMAARLVLSRLRAARIDIGSPYEFALEQAIKLAELPK
jgi:hypothetical protein